MQLPLPIAMYHCLRNGKFLFDLGDSQLVFPPEIAVNTQRPDIVIFFSIKESSPSC